MDPNRGDELNIPLRPRRFGDRLAGLRPPPMLLAILAVAAAYAGAVTWIYRSGDPTAGEQRITLPLPALSQASPAPDAAAAPEDPLPDEQPPAAAPTPPAAASSKAKIITLPAGKDAPAPDDALDATSLPDDAGSQEIDISEPKIALAPAPLRGLSEPGPYGPLPRIAPDGRTPAAAYARPLSPVQRARKARIAIVLGGMGLNAEITARAIAELPGEVTFAFAPYGSGLQQAVNQARSDGHEVMLQLPMEPFGYPANDPGPHTLTTAAGADANRANLAWHLGRFAGYFGVVNYLGARFASDAASIAPVLAELRARGLAYLDDGSAARSLAQSGPGLARARFNLDNAGSQGGVAAMLSLAEAEAKSGKTVIIAGTGLAPTLNAITEWAAGLSGRGVTLVPASAAF